MKPKRNGALPTCGLLAAGQSSLRSRQSCSSISFLLSLLPFLSCFYLLPLASIFSFLLLSSSSRFYLFPLASIFSLLLVFLWLLCLPCVGFVSSVCVFPTRCSAALRQNEWNSHADAKLVYNETKSTCHKGRICCSCIASSSLAFLAPASPSKNAFLQDLL